MTLCWYLVICLFIYFSFQFFCNRFNGGDLVAIESHSENEFLYQLLHLMNSDSKYRCMYCMNMFISVMVYLKKNTRKKCYEQKNYVKIGKFRNITVITIFRNLKIIENDFVGNCSWLILSWRFLLANLWNFDFLRKMGQ